jgi:hypothetical protein
MSGPTNWAQLPGNRQAPLRGRGRNGVDRRLTRSVVETIGFGEGQRPLSLAVAQGIGPPPESRH